MIEPDAVEPTRTKITAGSKAYKLRIKYNDGKVRNKIYAVNNDEEFQSLADKAHIFRMKPNVVDVEILRTRLPNKFADPLRIKYKQATERPKFLLKVDESGAIVTPAEQNLDQAD